MEHIKEMLKKMGFEIVADEKQNTEWTKSNGFFVVNIYDIYHRVDYTVVSYGSEPSIVSVREVKPQQVTKVEYI